LKNYYKVTGYAFILYGFLGLAISIYFGSNSDGLAFNNFNTIFVYVLYCLFITVHFLAFLSGFYLIKGAPKVHKVALPIAIIIMLNFPIGSAIGGFYLWQYSKYKDKT